MPRAEDDAVIAVGPCFCCARPFQFNPHRVPSIEAGGTRRPICRECMDAANEMRRQAGDPPHPILDGAYGPMPATDL